jgi:hypothetical protein
MNISILSTEEIIRYVESGLIDSVPTETLLKLTQEVKELKEALQDAENNYSRGWDAAISEMQGALDNL